MTSENSSNQSAQPHGPSDGPSCAVAAGSPLGDFMLKDATHGGIFKLSNGAELALAKNADGGWAFSGKVGGVTRTIAFTPEACDMIFGAMLFYRDHSKPALRVELREMANNADERRDPN